MRVISDSELMLTDDGRPFHLRMRPEDLSDHVVLVGDRSRVKLIGEHLSNVRVCSENREYYSICGDYRGHPVTVLSIGIGAGNVDIAVNELNALANIDLTTLTNRSTKRVLQLLRIGTSGAVQPTTAPGSALISAITIGFDSVPYFYKNALKHFDLECTAQIVDCMQIDSTIVPYTITSTPTMLQQFSAIGEIGITLSMPGFYGAQARYLSAKPHYANWIQDALRFSYRGLQIVNMEMESAPLNAIARLLGHDSITVCMAINNRQDQAVMNDYRASMHDLVEKSLSAYFSG